ncbi:putative Plexin-B [Hypsibius exemplaris]|uniref:Plexin-B n=1 Tax=Hypsibius exemplaris TaxID=2072580 RepID=A0A1W0WZB5_HYPEX|nr:putative Plexin-B [Hypsibius exemplaris]
MWYHPLVAEALLVYGEERITAVLAASTADNTVIFAATQAGAVRKVLVKTRQLAMEYGVIYLESSKAGDRNLPSGPSSLTHPGAFLYALTKQQVIKAAVAECGIYSTCSDCIRSQDPFCGWCTLKNRCTQQQECRFLDHTARLTGRSGSDGSPPKWLPFSAGQCIDFYLDYSRPHSCHSA